VDRLTRRELKQDELRTTFEHYEHYIKEHYREILGVTGIAVVVVGLVVGLRLYSDRQEAEANAQLGAALKTFRAYVGMPTPGSFDTGSETFPVASAKYKKALAQFSEVIQRFPRTKAAEIARYHMGLCQAQLGNKADAIKTLEEAGKASDKEIAALAQFALAGEMAASGKVQEAAKIYQYLADHPTSTVPQATALLALADAYRATQPAQAKQIYERLQKEYASNASLAQTLKQQLDSLPK
jgi:TolA-binding protein